MPKYMYLAVLWTMMHSLSAQNSNLILNGAMEYDHISYFKNMEHKINGRNTATLSLELKTNQTRNHSFYSAIECREDLNDPLRNRIYLKEGFLKFRYGVFDIVVGRQNIAWGKTDGLNVVNIVNPIEYTDLLDTEGETLGVDALNIKLFMDDWDFQGVFLPVYSSSILPYYPESRWHVDLGERIANTPGLENTTPQFSPPVKPPTDIRGYQMAFSINGAYKGVDLSLYYYNGYNHIPEIETEIALTSDESTTILIQQNYYPRQMIGAAFSTGVAYWGLRGEGACFLPKNIKNTTPYFQYIVGADRTFSNFLGNNNLLVIAQWIQEISSEGSQFSNRNLNHLFQKNVMLRTELQLGTIAQFNLQGLYNIKHEDYYIQTEFEYNLSDGLNLSLLADWLNGPAGSFFYDYRNNNRMQLKLLYNF